MNFKPRVIRPDDVQLYRPSEKSCGDVVELISRQHTLTDEEIIEYLNGKDLPEDDDGTRSSRNTVNEPLEHKLLRQAYHRRREEIRKLTARWKQGRGDAEIDQDGRLVPIIEPPQPPRANLPPGPPPPGVVNNNVDNNNDNNNDDDFAGLVFQNIDQRQEEQQFYDRERQEAETAIASVVQRLRNQGVPDDEFEVILISPQGTPSDPVHQDPVRGGLQNMTLRRILLGLFAFFAALSFVLLQTFPLFSTPESVTPEFDNLMYEVLNVRLWTSHVKECSSLDNRQERTGTLLSDWRLMFQKIKNNISWKELLYWNSTLSTLTDTNGSLVDCSDGVLHFPNPKQIMSENRMNSRTVEEAEAIEGYINGVDISWSVPCVPNINQKFQQDNNLQCSQMLVVILKNKDNVCTHRRMTNLSCVYNLVTIVSVGYMIISLVNSR